MPLLTVMIALTISPAQAIAAEPLVGRASVIDGDTIEILGERIRFNGVDAPEGRQLCQDAKGKDYRCGQIAANALDGFLAKSQPTTCKFIERDRYDRFVGDCYRADGQSVARWLVQSGHAMDWPQYSNRAYAGEQSAAKAAGAGIWAGAFQQPWDWRAAQRDAAPAPIQPLVSAANTGSCNIKGNISKKGARIYHVPGQKYYEQTVISEGQGERWFCTEADARAAGWRKSKT